MSSIPGIIEATGVQLEANALNTFGAAVANQSGAILPTALEALGLGNSIPPIIDEGPQLIQDLALSRPSEWTSTQYAAAIASGAGGFDPKLKFLFKVVFKLNPGIIDELTTTFGITNINQFTSDLTFVVKSIELPKYRFDYEEVNYYNFRTQILKRIMHEDLDFTMYDSTGNQALNFLNAYLQLLMPSSRQPFTTNFSLWDHGFAFSPSPTQGIDSGARTELGNNGNQINIFDQIIIDQYYLSRDPSANLRGPNIIQAVKANSFIFTNPKLTHFSLGEQDSEEGNQPQMIRCGITYDTLYMKTGQSGVVVNNSGPVMAQDILAGNSQASYSNASNIIGGGGTNVNPFLNTIGGVAATIASRSVGQYIARNANIGNFPGSGFLTNVAAGSLGEAVSNTIRNIGSLSPNIVTPQVPVLSDNSESPTQAAGLTSQIAAITSVF
jgi:hypothetical protein